MRASGVVLFALAVSGAACTFGSLADFTVQTCAPASSQSADVCDRLNKGNTTTCNPWQCDGATGGCVQKTRDDDRDGDPPITCGGRDCEDEDPELNSLHVATPTPGATITLGSATPTLSYDGVTPMIAFATTDNGIPCVAAGVGSGTGTIGTCSAKVSNGSMQPYDPAQPYALAVDPTNPTDVATAFVATRGCADGSVGFDYVSSSAEQATADTGCKGAAFPSLSITDDGRAAIAYYATPVTPFTTASALAVCSSLAGAPIEVAAVGDISQPTIGPSTQLAADAKSVAPPATLWIAPTFLVASPASNAVSLWALDDSLVMKATLSLPALANARQVAMGFTTSGATTHLAVVATLGCTDQAIHLALVDFDGSHLTMVADVEVSPAASGFKDAPSVAWSSARNLWLTAWIASGPAAFGRFVDASAKPSEAEFQIESGAFGVVALTSAGAILISAMGNGSDMLSSSKVRCP